MTLSLNRTFNVGAIGAALIWTTASFGALVAPAPAAAKGDAPFYTAQLAQPAAERTVIAGGLAWTCEGTTCVASKGTSRPLRVCRELNRGAGEVTSFTAKGEALEAAELAKCNG